MKTTYTKLVIALAAAMAVSSQAETATAQRRGLPFGIGSQFARNVIQPRQNTSQPTTTNNQTTNRNATNSGLSFGGNGTSVAISLGPGGVGVGVGTKDTAVAVAVGGGSVGVGVAHESGTAVSVGAGGGDLSVGISNGSENRLFGGVPQQAPPAAAQGFGSRQQSQGGSFSNQLYPQRTSLGLTGNRLTGSRLTGQSGYWQFNR